MKIDEELNMADNLERGMRLLPDSAATYYEWRRIVSRYDVRGLQVHDARLVAAMIVHGVTHILTLNGKHFSRFDGVTAIQKAFDIAHCRFLARLPTHGKI